MSNITRKVSGTKRRKTNLQTSDKSNPQTGDKSGEKSSPQTKPQTGDKTNPQTGDKTNDKSSPQTKPQTNITTYSDMFSGMFNNIGRKYNNKYNYYGDICAQIKETLKKDIDELTVVNYLYDYSSLLNRLKSFQAFVQRGLSNSFQDNIQVDILNNLSKQCDTEIAVCETIMSQIENISLTDIFKDYIPIFNEMNNEMSNEMNDEMSNEMNNEIEIPFIQNYVDIIEKIKIKKKCKQTLVSKCMDIIKLQAIRIKEILSDQDNILNTLERLDKNKTMKSMINYFNILSPLYVEKILKNIDHVNSLLLESYLVDNLNKIYERLLKSFIEEIDPNSYVENLGMKKDRLYLYNDGSYEYNKICQSARGSICYYMKPLYKTDDPVKEVKKYVKDVKIKKLSINGDNKTVYYL